MKMFATAAALSLVAATASAKTLSVNCPLKEATSLDYVATIDNASSPLKMKSFKVNGSQVPSMRDISKLPVYSAGVFNITLAFGPQFYSSAIIQAEKCADSFESKATAEVKHYVGGFAGTHRVTLDCTCNFK